MMLYAVSILLTLGIFIMDLQTPLGSGEWLFYFLPLLIVSRTPRIRSVYIFTSVVTVLVALGYLLSPGPPNIQPALALRNRLLAVGVLWVTGVILVQRRQTLEKLDQAYEGLEERVRERTAELERAGEVIQENEERFRTSVETMLDGFAILSAIRDGAGQIVDFRYEYINEAGCRMNGRSREDTLGHTTLEMFPAAEGSEWFKAYVRTVETGEPLVREAFIYSGVFAGGEVSSRVFDLRAVKLGGGLAVSWMDVTERVRMEEALRRSHEELEEKVRERTAELAQANEALKESGERFRRLFDQSPLGTMLVALDFRFLRVNETFSRITGYSLEELASLTFPDFTHPEDLEADLAQARRLLAGEIEQYEMEKRYIRKDGGIVWVRLNVRGIRDEEGRLLYFLPIVEDITERKRIEERLRETTRTLEELIQVAPVGISVLDPEGRVLLWNPVMEKITGWAEEEVRGRLIFSVEEGQEGAKENLERLLAGQALDGAEIRRTRKDGQPVFIRFWTAYVREDDGRIKGIITINLDVTRLKEMERMALTQQKLASLGQVAAGIAHEIRNPLSGLNIYLDSLEMFLGEAEISDPEFREKTEAVIAGLKAVSTKMESVIQRVLAFSRPGPPRMEPFDVNACIRDAVDMAKIALQKAGTRVMVALQEDLPLCRGDMRLIEQALLNLMTNAGQAMEERGGQRMIEVSSSLVCSVPGVGYHVAVSVADSGPGIPEVFRERIFDPFFTTKGSGTGIGLSITQKIVSDHGGLIRVGTSRWGGALFTIGLPVGDEREIPAA